MEGDSVKQNKKKVALIVALVLLLTLAGAAGTWAFFTREAIATNVITTGTVEMELYEMQDENGELKEYPNEPIGNVMPGLSVSKIPYIENVGTQPFWTRAKVTVTILGADGQPLPTEVEGVEMVSVNVDGEAWLLKDGWYYYTAPLNPGEDGHGDSVQLFTEASFAPEMGNAYQGCHVEIDVQAQAVQTKNNPIPADGDVTDIPGWPAEKSE